MVLDSNILIGYLNGDGSIISALRAWRDSGVVLFISAVSAIEALSLASLAPSNLAAIENFLQDFVLIPVDTRVITTAGELRRNYRLSVPDAAILASAVVNNLALATRDKQMLSVPNIDFAHI